MRKLIGAVLLIALFSGCATFKYYDRWEKCVELNYRTIEHLKEAEAIIDSLVIINNELQRERDSWRISKDGTKTRRSF